MSVEWYERELSRVFSKSWTLIGREDEISKPGDYLSFDSPHSGPVAVCRGNDGKIHAFANVCCHRGAKVLQDTKGTGAKVGLVCPYHAWTYDFNGKLKWAPGFNKTKNFDETNIRLAPIRVETFHGFVFVCDDHSVPTLRKRLGDLPEKLPEWFGDRDGKARDMVCSGRRDYVVNCNWKFLMENTCETYHTSVVHKDSLGPMKSSPMEPHVGDWDGVCVPSDRSIVPLPNDFPGELAPLPTFAKRTVFVNLFPSLQFNVTFDCMWWMRLTPLSVNRTQISMGFCFPKETVQRPRFQNVFEQYKKRWHKAVSEDNAISLNQQSGLKSRHRKPGRFCQLEFGTHNFNNWLVSRVVDGARSWDAGRRVYVGNEFWSNDDPKLQRLVRSMKN